MHEHTEGEQSFKVLSPDRSTSRKAAGRLVRRYWFVFVVAFLATAAIIGAAAGLASKRHTVAEVYFSPAQISAGVAATWTSYVVIDQGTVLVSRAHLVNSFYHTNFAFLVDLSCYPYTHTHTRGVLKSRTLHCVHTGPSSPLQPFLILRR